MSQLDKRRFGAAVALAQLRGKDILEIWSNTDGIEFVYADGAGSRSLTLRGEIYWCCFKEPGGTYFRANSIPLAGPKTLVPLFASDSVSSLGIYESENTGYHYDQFLLIKVRTIDGQLQNWLVEWIWGDEPEGIQIQELKNMPARYAPVVLPPDYVTSSPQGLFSTRICKEALEFASQAHARQKTPQGLPYTVHVNSVSMEVVQSLHIDPLSYDEGTLANCCALLHDTVEDTGTAFHNLGRFGSEVVSGVSALTKDKGANKEVAMADSLTRLVLQPYAVQRVKLADRICNLGPPPIYWNADKCRNYQKEARTILAALEKASPYLAMRLAEKIEAYNGYIEEFEEHQFLVFMRHVASRGKAGGKVDKAIFPLKKDEPDYFAKVKATIVLNNALYSKREFSLFKSSHKPEEDQDFSLKGEEAIEHLLTRKYKQLDAQQLYETYLAPLDQEDEWLQRQIRQWADVFGVELVQK